MTRPRLRRAQETRWTLTCTIAASATLVAGALGVLAHELRTPYRALIVAAAFGHLLMWAAPVSAALFALARRWAAVSFAVVVTTFAALVQVPMYLGSPFLAGPGRVLVLQANLRMGSADPAALVRIVVSDRVQVLTTEELTGGERDRLVAAGLAAALPYRLDASYRGGAAGLAIWSEYPLSDERSYRGFILGSVSATVHAPTGNFTIFAVHLVAPFPQPAGQWVAEISRLDGVLKDAARATAPIIVGADLNATYDTAQFRALLGGSYRDAAAQRGAGYLATYPGDSWLPPLIGIDHILISHGQAASVRTVSLPGSDHRGLLASIHLDGRG